MDTLYNVNIEVCVKPIIHKTVPQISYGFDNTIINTIDLSIPCMLSFNHDFDKGPHSFWVQFLNKDYSERTPDQGIDMAVEIDSVAIHDIKLDRLKWAGKFYPMYPKDCEHNDTVLQPHTYLGWNGKWVIEFYTPVFTWIHRLENLGWLYSA